MLRFNLSACAAGLWTPDLLADCHFLVPTITREREPIARILALYADGPGFASTGDAIPMGDQLPQGGQRRFSHIWEPANMPQFLTSGQAVRENRIGLRGAWRVREPAVGELGFALDTLVLTGSLQNGPRAFAGGAVFITSINCGIPFEKQP